MQGAVANGLIFDPLAELTIPAGWVASAAVFLEVVGKLRKEINSMERDTGLSC